MELILLIHKIIINLTPSIPQLSRNPSDPINNKLFPICCIDMIATSYKLTDYTDIIMQSSSSLDGLYLFYIYYIYGKCWGLENQEKSIGVHQASWLTQLKDNNTINCDWGKPMDEYFNNKTI